MRLAQPKLARPSCTTVHCSTVHMPAVVCVSHALHSTLDMRCGLVFGTCCLGGAGVLGKEGCCVLAPMAALAATPGHMLSRVVCLYVSVCLLCGLQRKRSRRRPPSSACTNTMACRGVHVGCGKQWPGSTSASAAAATPRLQQLLSKHSFDISCIVLYDLGELRACRAHDVEFSCSNNSQGAWSPVLL